MNGLDLDAGDRRNSGGKDAKDGDTGTDNSDADDDSANEMKDDEDDESASDNKDSEYDSDSGSSSNDEGSDDDSDNQQDGNGNGGLSEYERLRLERIKRNQERLRQLGLESKDGTGVLGKKKPSKPKKSRSSTGSANNFTGPRRKSSRSTAAVDYAEPSISQYFRPDGKPVAKKNSTNDGAEAAGSDGPQTKQPPRPKEKNRSSRLVRFVYDEFQRIEKHKRRMLKRAEINMRSAETEVKHWEKKAMVVDKKVKKEMEAEKLRKRLKEEEAIYGTSARNFLHQLDQGLNEILANMRQYEYKALAEEHRVDSEVRRLENENKLKLLDAYDTYSKSMKEAVRLLNSFLLERAPKDPPPPRRSKRKNEEEECNTTEPPPKKKKEHGQIVEQGGSGLGTSFSQAGDLSTAATQASMSQAPSELKPKREDEGSPDRGNEGGKLKRKRELYVGGPVSPNFGPFIDRSWLAKDFPPKHFELKAYVPQPNDTVLYYPAGHFHFLKEHPDHIEKNKITRMPLWERAKKEKRKSERADTQQLTETSPKKQTPTFSTQQKIWWTEEWISGVEGSLGKYPIICRVEKAQAEFPPDPHEAVVENNKLIFKQPDNAPASNAKKNKNISVRLAVTLRPLTVVLPPTWTEAGPVDSHSLIPPPSFTAVMFPSQFQPYLIPLAWGYISNHSLSLNEEIAIPHARGAQKGHVRSFETLDGNFGSFRLEDKASIVTNVLCNSSSDYSNETVLVNGSRTKGQALTVLPPQDAVVIREFLSRFLATDNFPTKQENSPTIPDESSEAVEFLQLIRSTLPLWNGVSLFRDMYDRRAFLASGWLLNSKKPRKSEDATVESLRNFLDIGLPSTLDNVLRLKLECTVEDFLGEKGETEAFMAPPTDAMAQNYSSFVPISMSFSRILDRLKSRMSPHGDERCYYRSVEALISDLDAIENNCSLYNAPDSPIVQSANEVIATIKKSLSNVASCHVKERIEKLKAEHEKKEFVLLACNSSGLVASDDVRGGAGDNEKTQSIDPFREPYKGELYRDWIQLTLPDATWGKSEASSYCQWVPQNGDKVLYSRKLHAEFVKGHYEILAIKQCQLPQLKSGSGQPTEQDSKGNGDHGHNGKEGKLDQNDKELDGIASNGAHASVQLEREEPSMKSCTTEDGGAKDDEWIAGTIVWVRAEFPRPRKSPQKLSVDKDETTSATTDAPILGLGMRFPDFQSRSDKPVVVYWRPCVFACLHSNPSTLSEQICRFCGVRLSTSFLRPSWVNQFGQKDGADGAAMVRNTESSHVKQPTGLQQDDVRAIERCLSLLKRRCMNQVAADYVDPKLTTESVKRGYRPQLTKIGLNSLPAFGDLLGVDFNSIGPAKAKTTRGGRSKEPDPSIPILSMVSFLPPWLPHALEEASGKKDCTSTLHQSISPWPMMCLELVLLRVQNGYYRQKAAIQNDIVEGYVTSVLLYLAPLAKRKKGPISIKKLARVLSTRKYSGIADAKSTQQSAQTSKRSQKAGRAGSLQALPPVTNAVAASQPKTMQIVTSPIRPKSNMSGTKSIKLPSSGKATKAKSPTKKLRITIHSNNGVSKASTKRKPASTKKMIPLSDQERSVLDRLEEIRRLYAVSYLCIADPTQVGYLFGLVSMAVSRQELREKMIPNPPPPEKLKAEHAYIILEKLQKALEREKLATTREIPSIKVKFLVEGEAVECDETASQSELADAGSAGKIVSSPKETPPAGIDEDIANSVAKELVAMDGANNHTSEMQTLGQYEVSAQPKSGDEMNTQGTTIVVKDGVLFEKSDLTSNESLSRFFFGTKERMHPCIRCQVLRKSFLSCRVRQDHSSPDFDVVKIFREEGGLKGLFRTLHQKPLLEEVEPVNSQADGAADDEGMEKDTSGCKAEAASNSGSSSNENRQSRTNLPNGDDHPESVLSSGTTNATAAVQNQNPGIPTDADIAVTGTDATNNGSVRKVDGPEAAPDLCSNNDSTQKASNETSAAPLKSDDCGNNIEEPDIDPRIMFQRAKKTYDEAKQLLASAKTYAEAPARLDEEFIACNFPFDTTDDHYVYCVLCGHSGDLLCCDGKNCANVVHPSCIEVDEIPDDDWFCDKCVAKGKHKHEKLTSDKTITNKTVARSAEQGPTKSCSRETCDGAANDTGQAIETAQPSVGKMRPMVVFDEEKAAKVKAELDELFFYRTKRRRGNKSEDVPDCTDEKEKAPSSKEETKPTTVPEPDAPITIGAKFLKKFGRMGYFEGEVTSLPTDTNLFYHVVYEDGDEEDLTEKQLRPLLSRKNTVKNKKKNQGQNPSTENTAQEQTTAEPKQKKKRGRPPKTINKISNEAAKEEGPSLKAELNHVVKGGSNQSNLKGSVNKQSEINQPTNRSLVEEVEYAEPPPEQEPQTKKARVAQTPQKKEAKRKSPTLAENTAGPGVGEPPKNNETPNKEARRMRRQPDRFAANVRR